MNSIECAFAEMDFLNRLRVLKGRLGIERDGDRAARPLKPSDVEQITRLWGEARRSHLLVDTTRVAAAFMPALIHDYEQRVARRRARRRAEV